jgi:hypothetical protein
MDSRLRGNDGRFIAVVDFQQHAISTELVLTGIARLIMMTG